MDETYDVVVCGTGLKECILSGLLSVHGKKVLHVDRNSYYGGESASLNLTNLFKKFKKETPSSELGQNRDWNVDLIPKFVMGNGKLVNILLRTNVTNYLEWRVIEGTYVYQYQKASFFAGTKYIHKVPANEREALSSSLMGLMEKPRFIRFLKYCLQFDKNDKNTWKGIDPFKDTMKDVYDSFKLQPSTIEFVGHAVALYPNDDYLNTPMHITIERIILYTNSILRFKQSPFIYPVYGLGGLPEGFSRLCAIHGGTFMLNTPIERFEYNSDGSVCGVVASNGEVAKCKMVVCDPSYLPPNSKKVKENGQIIRSISILNEPLPNTDGATSCQVIIPQSQLNRHNDIYITVISYSHGVAAQGKYIAIVSTTVETDNPLKEIEPALQILGPEIERFVEVSTVYQAVDDGKKDNVYTSSSFDATSHFESASDDVLLIWKNIIGEELDLNSESQEESTTN